MLSDSYQKRRDRLIESLDLSTAERLFIQKHHRDNLTARRVAMLIGDYVEAGTRSEREGLLKLLLEDAVPALRAVMLAAELVIPAGHVLVTEQQLQVLRDLALQAMRIRSCTGKKREMAVAHAKGLCEVVCNLDPIVAEAAAELALEGCG